MSEQVALLDRAAWLYLNEVDAAALTILDQAFPELQLQAVALADIRQDYYDLFCVPVSGRYLSPFESAQREGRLWGSITYQVAEWYALSGFNLGALTTSRIWHSQLIPDHIGYELAFYSALLSLPDQHEQAAAFRSRHLLPWVLTYAEALHQKARTPVYRLLAELTMQV
jgi:TorA maturation chaperone TorD